MEGSGNKTKTAILRELKWFILFLFKLEVLRYYICSCQYIEFYKKSVPGSN